MVAQIEKTTMNDFQQTLYTNLMTLCSNPEQEAFYYVDQSMGANLYRIFLYRMASYTEFQQPGALECRGHTFRIDAEGNALELVSLPMQKFFNYGELEGHINTTHELMKKARVAYENGELSEHLYVQLRNKHERVY